MIRISACIMVLMALLTACEGKESVKVAELQKKDKKLSCKEIKLEINEADYYRKAAQQNKSPTVGNLLMPLGYISTYVDAEDASHAAQARIDYLNRISEILKCDQQEEMQQQMQSSPTVTPMMSPAPYLPQ